MNVGAIGQMKAVIEFHPLTCTRRFETRVLAEKPSWVLKDHSVNGLCRMTSAAHFQSGIRYSQWNAYTPITSAVHPQSLRPVKLNHIGSSRSGALGLGVQSHAGPKPRVQDHLDCVLLYMVDNATFRPDPLVVPQNIQD